MNLFLKRIAAIDMGTNSFHLIIVEVDENGNLKPLDREREFIRLGSELGKDLSIISQDETSKAILILKKFHHLQNFIMQGYVQFL
jgi:exopolyphosphatase/guanosine-5'-triphosphate,3'-diphosphate pyrophosphatase